MNSENLSFSKIGEKVLLHCCCAPCSASILECVRSEGKAVTIFFFNPNIHPKKEYERRKQELVRLATEWNIPFFDADYSAEEWFQKTKGMEEEPERGKRCECCFLLRLKKTAEYAKKNGFFAFSTSLSASRWKDKEQIRRSGEKASEEYDILFWNRDWRKGGLSERGQKISQEKQFYRQQYCGCIYSLRDTNRWRKEKGFPPV
ncbi:epoxyqueuosine reductase QueH [Candidatus Peregrinibacteria bacterium]|nr:MAG: epoxyqueuosine reductase QueH [Candidatus Peregrinibacteria bacterium]